MERVMLTLPSDLLEDVDALARRMGRNRSQLVRQALRELLERRQHQEFEALLAEGYQAMAKETAALVSESIAWQSAATEGIWDWDE